jgi:hypothetical protein
VASAPANAPRFEGFQNFRANVTFVPLQFFTVVIPSGSRGTVRVVGYALRRILGWVDRNGEPTRTQLRFTYRELIEHAGVSRDSIAAALKEAIERRFLVCVQEPEPDSAGRQGQSGIYELCWDDEGPYTDKPGEFRGFYYPEAIVVEEIRDGVRSHRPKSARKNIPNAFFDYLLPREPLSVIRTVGALLFYSIEWGPAGERQVKVTKSISSLSSLTRMSRHHVHRAIVEARRQGYIVQVDGGCFDPAAAKDSKPAGYAIRWMSDAGMEATVPPVGKCEREKEDRSKRVNGQPVGKGARDRSEKVNGGQSEKVNDISIKTGILKTYTAAAVAGGVGGEVKTGTLVGSASFAALREVGFDESAARELAANHPADVIRRQIEWLPLRRTRHSRLGMLRRAIEQDWAKPDHGRTEDEPQRMARDFASHYYAGYHGFSGEAQTPPLDRDVETASAFILRLLAIDPSPTKIPEWGRRFGRLVRSRHPSGSAAPTFLWLTLVAYGDSFLQQLQGDRRNHSEAGQAKSRELHMARFRSAYLDFLRVEEARVRRDRPDLGTAFDTHRAELRRKMTDAAVRAPVTWLARFDSEESRLTGFAEFFARHPEHPVPDFWQWDQRFNTATSTGAANKEVRP